MCVHSVALRFFVIFESLNKKFTARRRFEDVSQVRVAWNVEIELLGGSFFSFLS